MAYVHFGRTSVRAPSYVQYSLSMAQKKKKIIKSSIDNSRARFDYDVEKTYSAGISLTGPETKSLRMGHGVLRGAYVQVKDDGAYLINLQVNPLLVNVAHLPEETRSRTRRLLLKAREIEELHLAKKSGRQIVPLKLSTKTRYIKVEIGVGRGKKNYDKRASIKKRDTDRDIARELKR
jgi:SsrA-binding protein